MNLYCASSYAQRDARRALEVDRTVARNGAVHLAGRYVPAGEILASRRVSIRIEEHTLMFFDPGTRELLRTRSSPLTWDQARTMRGTRPAGPPPRPSTEPVTAQCRARTSAPLRPALASSRCARAGR